MKMSQANYLKLKKMYEFTVENAGDADVEYIFQCLLVASKAMIEHLNAEEKRELN